MKKPPVLQMLTFFTIKNGREGIVLLRRFSPFGKVF
jgi:hypothetical protein